MNVIDMHCDTIYRLYNDWREGKEYRLRENKGHVDLLRMRKGNYCLQNFALYIDLEAAENPFECGMEMLDLFYREMEANKDLIGIVKKYKDIEENRQKGRMSALLAIEEGEACRGSLPFLHNFYRLGVRMMTLTWNYENSLAYPNAVKHHSDGTRETVADTKFGLKEAGIAFIQEMEKIGMIVDISHLNDAGIWDVFRYTKKPFVASHSNARSIASHPRNLTDEMIKALAERGGVAGINYCSTFLRDWNGEKEHSQVSDMVDHMKHMKQIGGISCIGLGSDYDGIDGALQMRSPADISLLADEMKKNGFTENEIDAVFYENVMRLYKDLLK
ncbi:dipeptidase [Lachnospiraceae bacterium 54-53]